MISGDVKTAYDEFYASDDISWRMLGAKYKAQNIVHVCRSIRPETVLEVGAGDGSILHFLDEWKFAKELYALEISESGTRRIKDRQLVSLKEAQIFDGYTIPYADNSFDLVILAHVLEHVEHERVLLRELKRVAKYVVIEVPRDYRFGVDKRMTHFLNYGHINMYTPTLLRFLLQSEGFEVIADRVSLTKPETTQFNEFVNQKRPESLIRKARIHLEYQIKIILGWLFGIKARETFANAYTVLVKKSDKGLHIF